MRVSPMVQKDNEYPKDLVMSGTPQSALNKDSAMTSVETAQPGSPQHGGGWKKEEEEEEEDESLKAVPWFQVLKNFTADTTMHGLRFYSLDMDRRLLIARRAFWVILTLSALGVFCFYCYGRVSEFLKFETVSSVSESYVTEMTFPTITICNQNPFLLTTASNKGWYTIAETLAKGVDNYTARPCTPNEFMCGNSDCIPDEKHCDSFPDCTDQSDEMHCNPCTRLYVASSVNLSSDALGQILAAPFNIQLDTAKDRVMYRRDYPYPELNLVYDGTRWMFVASLNLTFTAALAYVISDANTPQNVTSEWILIDGRTVNLDFGCAKPYFSPLVDNGAADNDLVLREIYDELAQPLQNMLKDCTWQGSPCGIHDFEKVFTERGVCYTFRQEDYTVKGSGPGSALMLTLNIEYYDYTSDPSKGSGVQVLLHSPNDVPIMSNGLAISPGLISMVALERTMVENQPPPWGACTSKALTYYDHYSTSTCSMDCQTELAVENCGCLDINMPQGDSNTPYCTVSEYNSCLKGELDPQTLTAKCPCGTPCLNTLFLPSLSFASTTTDDGSINRQDQAIANMQNRMTTAREVVYRVRSANYRGTSRILNIMYLILTQILAFLENFRQRSRATSDYAMAYSIDAATDCVTFSNRQFALLDELGNTPLRTVQRFMDFYSDSFYSNLLNYEAVIKNMTMDFREAESDYVSQHKTLRFAQQSATIWLSRARISIRNITVWTSYNNGTYYNLEFNSELMNSTKLMADWAQVVLPEDPFWSATTSIWTRFTALRGAYFSVTSSLDVLLGGLYTDLTDAIDNIQDNDYTLRKSLLNSLAPLLRAQCNFCSNDASDSLVDLVRTRMTDFVVPLKSRLETMLFSLEHTYLGFLSALANNNPANQNQIKDIDVPNIIADSEILWDNIDTELYNTLKTSTDLLDELLRHMRPKCHQLAIALPQKLTTSKSNVELLVTEINRVMDRHSSKFISDSLAYVSDNITLAELSGNVSFSDMTRFVLPRISSSQDILRERHLDIISLDASANSLFYWLMTQWSDTVLAASSVYWQRFQISSPEIDTPSDVPAVGNYSGWEQYRMKNSQDTAIEMSYFDLRSSLKMLSENLESHFTTMTTGAMEAEAFFSSFLTGNIISSDFYSKNILQLDVFYKSLTDKSVVEKKAYEYPTLLGELGGLLGLLLGASVMTIAEVFDMCVYNSCVRCLNMCGIGKRKNTKKPGRVVQVSAVSGNHHTWLP